MRQIDKAKFVSYANYVNLPKKLKYFYCVNRLLSCCLCCCCCCFSLERRAPASFEKCERWKRKCWLKIVSVYKYAHTHTHRRTVEHTCVFVHIKFILHAKWKSLPPPSPQFACSELLTQSVSQAPSLIRNTPPDAISSSISPSELQHHHRLHLISQSSRRCVVVVVVRRKREFQLPMSVNWFATDTPCPTPPLLATWARTRFVIVAHKKHNKKVAAMLLNGELRACC